MNNYPFPHLIIENYLDPVLASKCQEEILSIDMKLFDRYSNPFEKKWTLRDKNNLPENCTKLFEKLTSSDFVEELSNMVGEKLYNDHTKNWWGIHVYDNGDYLDIHSDAGIHPITKQKKHLTLGIYLSKDWKEENKGHLELWEGNSVMDDNPQITNLVKKILPSFNTLILFVNNSFAWHGNPEPVNTTTEKRIFLTLSYLSNKHDNDMNNNKDKAYFVKKPNDLNDTKIDKLRELRAKSETCKSIYSMFNI